MAQYKLTVVVPADMRASVNEKLAGLNHGETFTAPLSPPGVETPTHYWSSHSVDDDQLNKLLVILAAEVAESQALIAAGKPPRMVWFYDVDPFDALAQLNLRQLNS